MKSREFTFDYENNIQHGRGYKDIFSAAPDRYTADYELFYVTGRGSILVPRSEEAKRNLLEIGETIEFYSHTYEITGLEIMRSLMSIPKELSRAYKVIDITKRNEEKNND